MSTPIQAGELYINDTLIPRVDNKVMIKDSNGNEWEQDFE